MVGEMRVTGMGKGGAEVWGGRGEPVCRQKIGADSLGISI
jgi:hypothetical protein